jgi:predicted ribosomally synthesized peptide with SipW-like signal peptide
VALSRLVLWLLFLLLLSVSAAGLGGASVALFTDQATVGSNTFTTAASFPSACFSDDFNDGTLTGWTQLGSSTLREANGVLTTQAGSNTTTHYSISSGGSWTDYTYSIKVKGVDNDLSGIIFRVQDASNYYLLRQGFGDTDGWTLRLRKVVAGTQTDLATAINNFGSNPGQVNSRTTFYTFKVVVSGTSIKAYVDDVLKFEVTDSTYSGGSAGVWLFSQMDGAFDDAQVLCAGGGGIAVSNVSSTNSGSANASSLTWAHTVSGSNRYLVVGVSINNENSGTVSSVTYNGQALTSLGTATNGTNARVEMWGMLAPPTGTHNIVVTLSTSQRFTAGAVSFTGVHQTTPLGTLVSNTGTSLSASVAASSASGEVVVDVVAKKNSDSTLTVGADQTQRWNEVTTNSTTSNNVVGAASTEPGAASVTMSWFISGGSSRPWAIVAIPLKPAP